VLYDDVRETQQLAAWWADLEPEKRQSAIKRRPSDPMPVWMLATLRAAGVSGLDDQSANRADVVPPWVPMPEHVANFLALHCSESEAPAGRANTALRRRHSSNDKRP
jgi:hypothetical protein